MSVDSAKLILEYQWFMYVILIVVPLGGAFFPGLRRLVTDYRVDRFWHIFILVTLLSGVILFLLVLFLFLMPGGIGSNAVIELCFWGGFCVIPLNQIIAFFIASATNRRGHPMSFRTGNAGITAVTVLLIIWSVISLAVAVDMRFIEPYWIETNHVRCSIESKRAIGSLKIMHMTDFHFESDGVFHFNHVRNMTNRMMVDESPDIIVLTGDYLHDPDLTPYQDYFRTMHPPFGAFAVPGNFSAPDAELFRSVPNVRVLNNEWIHLTVRGVDYALIGIDFYSIRKLDTIVQDIPSDWNTILLCHTPDCFPRAKKLGIDLVLTGHTHGGQVCLPFYGAIITLTNLGPAYASGLFHERGTYLYVNKGLGCETGDVPRIRFLCRPEIAIIQCDIKKTNRQQSAILLPRKS